MTTSTVQEQGPQLRFDHGDVIMPGYRAWALLGSGPRCETWLAWSDRHGVPIALKVPLDEEENLQPARYALTRETELLRKIAHPSFQRLIDADLTGRLPFMATEYVEGPSLRYIWEDQGSMPAVEVAMIGVQVAAALRFLHCLGYAHMDVKPGNILIRSGRVVLIDLAFSQPIGQPPLPGGPRGTDGYMAPEQQRCANVVACSDLYALGVTLQELLDGPDSIEGDLASIGDRSEQRAVGLLREAIGLLTIEDPSERSRSARRALRRLARALPNPASRPWPAFVTTGFLSV